jgi:DNA-directed RNA polymerase subunit M/transcription elongation factor TFIIS
MSTSSVSTVLLTLKGECRKATLPLHSSGQLTSEILQKYVKKKEAPEEVATYTTTDDHYLSLFGYKKGKKGTENKTVLPAPHSELVLFGDILVIHHLGEWEQPLPYTIEQWMAFYQRRSSAGANKEEAEEDSEDEEEKEKEKGDDEEEEEEAEEDEEDDTEKDEFEDLVVAEEEDEPEPEPVRKPRRSTAYQKLDPSALKQEIALDQAPDAQPLRTMCIKSLSFLEKESFTTEDILSLERSIFEVTFLHAQKNYIPLNWRAPLFCEAYRQTVRTILSNLHPKSPVNNPRLLRRVQEGELTLAELPSLTSYEMFPENWFALKDKLLQREQKILEGNKSRATDQFECRRCRKRECTYYELQTRSADEPMTIFITCLNCGKEWRQGG